MARAATSKAAEAKPSTPKGTRRRRAKTPPPPPVDRRPWALWVALVIGAMLAVRLALNATGLVPVHFDEAQYWAYGQELDWGYFSKPPLVALVIRAATDLAGDSVFALRLASPLCHAAIAGLIFATGRRLWGAPTGFWAAAGYTAAPGVGVSALIASTDPVMMLGWAGALYALVRAVQGGGRAWWALVGLGLGAAVMAKYTGAVFALGALGYAAVSAPRRVIEVAPGAQTEAPPPRTAAARSRSAAALSRGAPALARVRAAIAGARRPHWLGAAIAAVVALAVVAPNIWWNAANGFVTVAHVAEDAAPGGAGYSLASLAGFAAAQVGVIGPVFLAAIAIAAWRWRDWRADWGMRLMLWQTVPLVVAMCALAFVTRAQPNWAAPAYVAGSLVAARVLVGWDWARALRAQVAIGAAALVSLLALALAYHTGAPDLPRALDPFKKMRIGGPFCEAALAAMAEEGAAVLLSDDRRRLSECMFAGTLGWDEVAVWNPELLPRNHAELVATLRPGDPRPMLLAVHSGGAAIAQRFATAREIETGTIRTHADREIPYELWLVEGFGDYGIDY